MKCLILGDGQLATEIIKQTDWVNVSRTGQFVDLNEPDSYRDYLEEGDFDVIINCMAYTNTMDNTKQPHWDTNYRSVMDLVDMCNVYNKKLVHISTDYIYANSVSNATENDVPAHIPNWYSYCKLLADAYVQARSDNYLLIRTSFRPRPFPFNKAWIDHLTSADYTDIIVEKIVKLINKNSRGVFNVGTKMKTLLELARETKLQCEPMFDDKSFIRPTDVTMNVDKLNKELNGE